MSISTPLRSDHDVQTAVQDELEWSPELDDASIGVSSDDGTVTLSGEVSTYLQRMAATRAALRVNGVRTVVENITVHPAISGTLTEADIAKSVERALEWTAGVPSTVKAELTGHVAKLTGEVQWNFERTNARRAIQRIKGIDYVQDLITLRVRPADASAAEHITAAIARNASLYGTNVAVHVAGNTATLTGTVRTWAQRRAAENIAWASLHITHIENQIIVNWL